jgi:hypothetical protein
MSVLFRLKYQYSGSPTRINPAATAESMGSSRMVFATSQIENPMNSTGVTG